MNEPPWTDQQKEAVCEVLAVLYWKLPGLEAQWLRTAALAEIEDALGETIRFDEEREEFRID